ncbi:hypothetical protein [Caballeronia sp. ATUFL_M2_KS44]|uniref:hypothetical protein n=1 Tax=Caballeronia sp. ATUFL_M2_KS44 TaxID=2921767 RepID=UPI0020295929|nr:hypothetical protein [Caballeronia sp. ATUFL_M2_KS44]
MNATQQKFMIGLIVFAGIAAVLALWSYSKRGDDASVPQELPASFAMVGEPLASLRPKLGLDQREFTPGRVAQVVTVPARPDGPAQRFGGFSLALGVSATIVYRDETPGIDPRLINQSATLKAAGGASSGEARATIIAMRGGGRLSLACTGPLPCVIKLD